MIDVSRQVRAVVEARRRLRSDPSPEADLNMLMAAYDLDTEAKRQAQENSDTFHLMCEGEVLDTLRFETQEVADVLAKTVYGSACVAVRCEGNSLCLHAEFETEVRDAMFRAAAVVAVKSMQRKSGTNGN